MTDLSIGNDQQVLQLRHDGDGLGVDPATWRAALANATPDPAVGIRHAEIRGDASYRIHVAAIPQQVGCHFHLQGLENYAIVAGEGILHFGRVSLSGSPSVSPEDWRQVPVKTGDVFVIPPGFAHQLRRTGNSELILVFGCPDSHLDDSQDRTLLPDAPR